MSEEMYEESERDLEASKKAVEKAKHEVALFVASVKALAKEILTPILGEEETAETLRTILHDDFTIAKSLHCLFGLRYRGLRDLPDEKIKQLLKLAKGNNLKAFQEFIQEKPGLDFGPGGVSLVGPGVWSLYHRSK